MKPTLVIMAAGMASRYGSMKQIQAFGPSGETIMDYSIHDAIDAGFGKIVFIIRKDFAEDFKNIFEPKLKGRIATEYVYQELTAYVGDFQVPEDRTKPWGTSHAILCAKDTVKEPFAVINADDFYGKDAFVKAAQFLQNECSEKVYALLGYELGNTLSANGSVSRGVCEVDDNNNLLEINERLKIYSYNGQIVYEEVDGTKHEVGNKSKASMNFWCFHPSLFTYLEKEFQSFLEKNRTNLKAEFLIPATADELVHSKSVAIKVLPTNAQWFGVTYKEDAPTVKESLHQLVAAGNYPNNLWAD
ncbi:MAG: sugar phosphate nucleotidyltransferase [Chitinophagaceae bacterium]